MWGVSNKHCLLTFFIFYVFRVHTRQGNFNFFKVRELSGNFMLCQKIECLLKCQGNVKEILQFQFVSNDEKPKMACAVLLTFWIHAKLFW